jgi:hypothetical protein
MDDLPDVFKILKYMLGFGILFIVLLATSNSHNFFSSLFIFSNAILIAGAFYGTGGLAGFLFAIPKVSQNKNVDPNEKYDDTKVVHNDNLVQISDWLTKIIVGIGLTKLSYIGPTIYLVGEKLGATLLGSNYIGNPKFGTNTSVAIIIYFAILGFMMVYMWTRLYFYSFLKLNLGRKYDASQKKLVSAKKDLQSAVTVLESAVTELEEVKVESKNAKTEIEAIVTTEPGVGQNIKKEQIKIWNDEKSENDPHKCKFGGNAESSGRKVSATVRETSYDNELFVVDIEVISTNPDNPLTGEVKFFLHPSFQPEVRIIPVVEGKAVNKLISYGAFTLGVETDNGTIKLELDLSEIPDAPKLFKER